MRLARLPILMLVSATLLCGQGASLSTATSVDGAAGRQQRMSSAADLLTPDDSAPHEESPPPQAPAESAPCLGEQVEIESKDIPTDLCLARADHIHAPGMVAELHSHSELVSTSGMALYGMHRLQI